MNAMVAITPADPLVNNMQKVRAKLRDIGVAPENPRADIAADEGIPNLAITLLPDDGAGLMIPLFVRAGRGKEKSWMALDGRRRIFGFQHLVDEGLLTLDHEIDLLVCATKEQQARATVLLNSEHLQPHPADKIRAIGNLAKKKMSTGAIAKALGYDEQEVKRFKALADVPSVCLDAYRDGKISVDDLRLIARLPDPDQQKEWGESAYNSHYFNTTGLRETVKGVRVDLNDARFSLVTEEAYTAAGGRLEQDLFNLLPPRVLDTEILEAVWKQRVELLKPVFEARGIEAFIPSSRQVHVPEGHSAGQATARDSWSIGQSVRKQRDNALDLAVRRRAIVGAEGFVFEDNLEIVADLVVAEGELCSYDWSGKRDIGAVSLFPDRTYGVRSQWSIKPLAPVETKPAETEAKTTVKQVDHSPYITPYREVEVRRVEIDSEGLNNALHERRTDMGTKGMIRDLADKPAVALVVLIAQMFKAAVLHSSSGDYESAARIRLTPFDTKLGVEPRLDGVVRLRLVAWGEKYAESGLRPIPFVQSLSYLDRMTLLAELVAISLDLREHSPGSQHARRSEADEIAELTAFDIRDYYSIGGDLLAAHPKKALLSMLEEMKVEDSTAEKMKKGELVAFVEEQAAEHRYAPESLNWRAKYAETASPDQFDEDDLEDEDDGEGGFEGDEDLEGADGLGIEGDLPADDSADGDGGLDEDLQDVLAADAQVQDATAIVDDDIEAQVAALMETSGLAEHLVRAQIEEARALQAETAQQSAATTGAANDADATIETGDVASDLSDAA